MNTQVTIKTVETSVINTRYIRTIEAEIVRETNKAILFQMRTEYAEAMGVQEQVWLPKKSIQRSSKVIFIPSWCAEKFRRGMGWPGAQRALPAA